MAFLEFLDGFQDHRVVHLVNLEAMANPFQQRYRELASEVFAKFLQPLEDHVIVIRIDVEQLVREQVEAERLDLLDDARRAGFVQKTAAPALNEVERDTD